MAGTQAASSVIPAQTAVMVDDEVAVELVIDSVVVLTVDSVLLDVLLVVLLVHVPHLTGHRSVSCIEDMVLTQSVPS